MSDYEQRFGAVGRVLSRDGLDRLRKARACVIGVGGVGVWTAEALARSGIGGLTLVDMDEVCVSNVNRQLHALDGNIGRPKVDVMADRIRRIHPECEVRADTRFYNGATSESILSDGFDCVVDAIDHGKTKCHLIDACVKREIPVVTVGGAGGMRDPTAVKVADLSRTEYDPLLQQVRKRLRTRYGFPRGKRKFGVECVFSTERPVFPLPDGEVCDSRDAAGGDMRLNCEGGFGTTAFASIRVCAKGTR